MCISNMTQVAIIKVFLYLFIWHCGKFVNYINTALAEYLPVGTAPP
jgi:hypothetical protein